MKKNQYCRLVFCAVISFVLFGQHGLGTEDAKTLLTKTLRSHSLERPWVSEVLPLIEISLIAEDSDDSAHYDAYFTGDLFVRRSDLEGLPSVVLHELWHAYWDKIAEGNGSWRGRIIGDVFRTFVAYVESRGWDREFSRGGCVQRLLGDSDSEIMAEELWGNGIEQLLLLVQDIRRLVQTRGQAQMVWDALRFSVPDGSRVNLPATYLKKAPQPRSQGFVAMDIAAYLHPGLFGLMSQPAERSKSFRLPADTAAFVEETLLGLTSNVEQWPDAFRTWQNDSQSRLWRDVPEQLQHASGVALTNALAQGTAPKEILKQYLMSLFRDYAPLMKWWMDLGRPTIRFGSTGGAVFRWDDAADALVFRRSTVQSMSVVAIGRRKRVNFYYLQEPQLGYALWRALSQR